MEIRQLEYFLAVVNEMNFSRAANRVHVVQSALSASVAKLEKELGVELFDRSRQKTFDDLADEDLIGWPAEYTMRSQVEDAFAAAGVTPHVPYELAADYAFTASLVRAGLGSVFMPHSDARRFPDLRAVSMQTAPTRSVFLAHAAHPRSGPAAAKLAELILASVDSTATP